MPTPAPRASIESFFEFNEYCAAALGADPDARDLEPLLAAANDKLTRAVSARTAAQRAVNRCAALRDFNFRGLMAAVEALVAREPRRPVRPLPRRGAERGDARLPAQAGQGGRARLERLPDRRAQPGGRPQRARQGARQGGGGQGRQHHHAAQAGGQADRPDAGRSEAGARLLPADQGGQEGGRDRSGRVVAAKWRLGGRVGRRKRPPRWRGQRDSPRPAVVGRGAGPNPTSLAGARSAEAAHVDGLPFRPPP